MKKYSVYGSDYLIPKNLQKDFKELVTKLPDWMGTYISELESEYESYKIF